MAQFLGIAKWNPEAFNETHRECDLSAAHKHG